MTTSDPREALDLIKGREEARGYAVAHEDRGAVRLTTIESQKDVPRLTEALEAALSCHEPDDLVGNGALVCVNCYDDGDMGSNLTWPCPTVRAIENALNEEEQG